EYGERDCHFQSLEEESPSPLSWLEPGNFFYRCSGIAIVGCHWAGMLLQAWRPGQQDPTSAGIGRPALDVLCVLAHDGLSENFTTRRGRHVDQSGRYRSGWL